MEATSVKTLETVMREMRGPIGDGGRGSADEEKIYWCREMRDQCADALQPVRDALWGLHDEMDPKFWARARLAAILGEREG